jgi:nicotinate-nucleotide adenylyltransferase
MKTALFFGSFNPVHVGHLVIANYIVEFTDIDELWFVPSPQSPFKKKSSLLAANHRLMLLNAALGDHPHMRVSDIELKLPVPSYTVDTLVYLKEKYPKRKFCLIMGSDNLSGLKKWKNYEVILEEHEIFVYPRPDHEAGDLKEHPNVHMVTAPIMEISSTMIRQGIKEKKDLRFLVPNGAWELIDEMHFYRK